MLKTPKSKALRKLEKIDFASLSVGAEKIKQSLSNHDKEFYPDLYRLAGVANTAEKLGYAEVEVAKKLSIDLTTLRKLKTRYPDATVSVRAFLGTKPSKNQ